jgi:hypothetical protein
MTMVNDHVASEQPCSFRRRCSSPPFSHPMCQAMNTLTIPYAMSPSAPALGIEPDADGLFVALRRVWQLAQTIDAGDRLPRTVRRSPNDVPATAPAVSPRGDWAEALSTVVSVAWRLPFVAMAMIGIGVTALQFVPHPARPTLMPSGMVVSAPRALRLR